ncbi:MAG: alpha/beta hydrolase family protein [Thermomicrobiales bacterium]
MTADPVAATQAMTFTDGRNTLAGTLHLPPGTAPQRGWPALVMIAGSGDSDRDASGWFAPIRNAFLQNGIAVLSWDKPGCGGSSGHWTTQTFPHRANEALAGLAWLRAHPGIDPTRTGLWGHSQGGWIGPIVAARDPDLRALVVNAGPAVDVHAQDLYGVEHTMRDAGKSDVEIRRALAATERLHGAAIAGLSFAQLERLVPELHMKDGPLAYFEGMTPAVWHFFCLNANPVLDPMDVLPSIRCPTLAVYGADDPLTPPEQSAALFRQAFDRPGAPPLTIRIYPGAGHRLETQGPGTFADGYLDGLGTWMADALG